MNKLNLLLLVALLASALLLVDSAYDARRLFATIEKARADERALDSEYKRLDAERQAQATHLRVERVAREKLQMRPATPAVTAYVNDPAASAALAGGTPSASAAHSGLDVVQTAARSGAVR